MLAGAGIGVSRIHDHDLRDSFFYAFNANLHWRGANLIRREHAGDNGGRFGNDERKVTLQTFVRAFAGTNPFDVAKNAAGQKAFGRNDGTGNFFERFQFDFY